MREPRNRNDPLAIAVHNMDAVRAVYVSKAEASLMAPLMDNRVTEFRARIAPLDTGRWDMPHGVSSNHSLTS